MTSTVATRPRTSPRRQESTVRFVDISGDDDIVDTNVAPDEDTVTVARGRSTDSSTRRVRSARPSVVVEESNVDNIRRLDEDSAEDDLFDSVIPRWRSNGSNGNGNHTALPSSAAVASAATAAVRDIDPSNTDTGVSADADVINLSSDDDDEQEFGTLQELLDEAGIATIVKKTTSNSKNGNDNHVDDDFGSADNRAFKKPRRENGAAGGEPITTVSISDDEDDDFDSVKSSNAPHGASVPPRYRVNSTLEHDNLVPDDAKPHVIDADATPPVVIPAHIAYRLRQYQIEGVEFLYRRCFIEDSGAILGDDMGMGKTIQSIAFLSAVLRVGDERRAVGYFMSPDRSRPVALVVLPASVILQWDAEIKKWSTLRVASFQGSERRRALHNIQTRRCDVMLISYEMLRTNREQIEDIAWTCIIFDEIHRLKNIHSKLTVECSKLNCKRRVGLTGTVMQNNFEELHGIINFVAPGLLGPYRTFKQWYVDPIVSGQEYSALKSATNNGRHASRRLHAKLQQVMLRRKKELIAEELPGKEDNVVFCNLTELQRRLYERALAVPEVTLLRRLVDRCQCGSGNLFGTCCGSSQSLALGGGLVVDWKKEVLRTISRLNNLANHPVLLSPQARDPPEKRERDAVFQAHVLGPDAVTVRTAMLDQNHALLSGKMHVLSALLRRWSADVPRNKVLLFSRSTLTLDMLGGHLARLGILYLRLDGSTTNKRRDQLVAQFQSLDSPQWVFLVSTRAGGLGLNLTAANIVVVFDPNWNHTWDLQAQDRAYRIGQQRYTRVYRFISTGTLEELLYVRQVYKQQFSSIAQEGAKERRFFNRDELFGLRQLLNPVSDVARTATILERSQPQAERMPSVRPGGAKSATKSENEPIDESFFRIERERATDGGLLNDDDKVKQEQQQQHEHDSSVHGNPQTSAVFDEPVTDKERADLAQYERDIETLQVAGVSYYHAHDKVVGQSDQEADGPANADWAEQFDHATSMAQHDDGALNFGLESTAALFAGMSTPNNGSSFKGSSSMRTAASAKARIKRKRSAKLLSLTQQQQQEAMRSLFGTTSTFMQAHARSLEQQAQPSWSNTPALPRWQSQADGMLDLTDNNGSPERAHENVNSGTSSHSPRLGDLQQDGAAYQQHFASGPPRSAISSANAFTGMFPAPARAQMGRSLSTGSLISLGSMAFGEAEGSPIGLPRPVAYSPPVVSLLDSPAAAAHGGTPVAHGGAPIASRQLASVVVSDED